MNDTPTARSRLDSATRFVALAGFSGLVVIGVLTMLDGLARQFGLPRLPGFGDVTQMFFAIIIASCFPAGLLHNQNISVTFLGKALGKRAEAWLEVFASCVTFIVFALLTYQFFLMTVDYQATGRVTPTILVPVAPWWWVTTAIITLCLPVQMWMVWARLQEAATGKTLIDDHMASTDELIAEELQDLGGKGGTGPV